MRKFQYSHRRAHWGCRAILPFVTLIIAKIYPKVGSDVTASATDAVKDFSTLGRWMSKSSGIVVIDAGYSNNTTFLLELEKRQLN
ncbi:MAG TPA: hypothetical protein DDZ80_07910 [Cyanobacteria bacterium UBA8803]|nr:hypothetical protein [Cyanobacteria bacterium UBA9273]HBL58431.1 hypothetical protein [Cyanobacteria bacterium UBA8803]